MICSKCGKDKPIDDFYQFQKSNWCKECQKEYRRKRYYEKEIVKPTESNFDRIMEKYKR